MTRLPRCFAPTIADALHLAAARIIVRARSDERESLVERVRGLGREAWGLRRRGDIAIQRLVLDQAGVSNLDLEARRAAAKLASSDHWLHWLHWLRWFEAPRSAAYANAELADEVLRACTVCGELRLDLIA